MKIDSSQLLSAGAIALTTLQLAPSSAWASQGADFTPGATLSSTATAARSLVVADLDGDGDLDTAYASRLEHRIGWFENLGDGQFGLEQEVTDEADGIWFLHAADLDADGRVDLLQGAPGSLTYLPNEGGGSFGEPRPLSLSIIDPRSVDTADLDGDGDLDVLVGSRFDDHVAWFENDGHGSFGPMQTIATAVWQVLSVHATDLDGDGDLDVVAGTHQQTSSLYWFENDGAGRFEEPHRLDDAGPLIRLVSSTDVDGDGDRDILLATSGDDRITWLENDGDGGLGSPRVITYSARDARAIRATDLDGDGDTDLLCASSQNDRIAWHENLRGGAAWTLHVLSNSADGASDVGSGDLDGDGDLDLIASSGVDDTIAAFENLRVNTGSAFCLGDGSEGPCPCIDGTPGGGCLNSVGTAALLAGTGSARLGADSFALSVTGACPEAFGLLLEGDLVARAPLGNGISCLETVSRGAILLTDLSGAAARKALGAGAAPGETREYQFLYRETSTLCGSTLNLSNGWTVTWY